MAVAPGFSITELVQVLYRCKEIYRAFCSKDDSAAKRLAAFGHELDRAEGALKYDDRIFSWSGQHYPGLKAFENNLAACLKFLRENWTIFDRNYARNPGGAIRTLLTAFDDELPRLRQKLNYDWQEFTDFKVTLILEQAIQRSEQPIAATGRSVAQTTPPAVVPNRQSIKVQPQDASTELVLILNRYKRLNSRSDQDEELELLNNRFWSCYWSLCEQNGLLDDYQVPVIPLADLQKYVDNARQSYALQGTSRTWRSRPVAALLLSRTCVVTITAGPEDPICAAGYLMLGRTCRFLNAEKQTVFEHQLSSRTSCYTQFNTVKKPLTLGFLEEQYIIDFPAGTQPEYQFHDKSAYRHFQEDIEGKTSMLESRVSSIKSQHSGPTGIAINVYAKLWKNHDQSAEPWLTFPAMLQTRRKVWTVPLRWFNDLAMPAQDTSKTITMQLTRPPESPGPTGERRNSLARKLMSINPHSRRPSVSSIQSDTDSLASFTTSQLAGSYAPQAWIDRVGYVQMTFENAQERIAFVEMFRQLRETLPQNAPDTANASTAGSLYAPSLHSNMSSSSQTPSTTPFTSPAMVGQSPPQSIPRVPVGSRSGSTAASPSLSSGQVADGYRLQTLDLGTATTLVRLETVLDEEEMERMHDARG